jgi:hypothetical protein
MLDKKPLHSSSYRYMLGGNLMRTAQNKAVMVRIADGRVAESWVKNDVQGLMRQLDASSPSR